MNITSLVEHYKPFFFMLVNINIKQNKKNTSRGHKDLLLDQKIYLELLSLLFVFGKFYLSPIYYPFKA